MLITTAFLSFALTVFYLLLISSLMKGWNNIPDFVSKNEMVKDDQAILIKPSIVIACKNEERNLPHLIEAFQQQSYQDFELIWVNDFSTDNTAQMLQTSLVKFTDSKILQSPKPGKKHAQALGIKTASNDFIITTDADCVPDSKWIQTLVEFQHKQQADLIIAPVKFNDGHTYFAKLQELEFATLVGSGLAAAGNGKAIFCNAANMAFSKRSWLDSQSDLHQEEISGDDVFLLHAIKKRKGKIVPLLSPDAVVMTTPSPDLKSFLHQRARWASKSFKYTDWDSIATGLTVSTINVLLLVLFFVGAFYPKIWNLWGMIFLIKFFVDYIFLLKIKDFFRLKFSFRMVLSLSFLYPLYVGLVGLKSVFRRKKDW